MKSAAQAHSRGFVVSMSSSLGDHFQGALDEGCVDARIRQSPKLPNRITITVTDAHGGIVGSAVTNDLARVAFDIPLASGTVLTVTPGGSCKN